jgi:hypothetical protein
MGGLVMRTLLDLCIVSSWPPISTNPERFIPVTTLDSPAAAAAAAASLNRTSARRARRFCGARKRCPHLAGER